MLAAVLAILHFFPAQKDTCTAAVRAPAQAFAVVITHLPEALAHHALHDPVHRVNHAFFAAKVVIHQNELAAFGFPAEFARLFAENKRVRQPEFIDALLDIPHHEQASLARDRTDNFLLHRIGVLIFVHKNILISSRIQRAHVFVLQGPERKMLHIGIVEHIRVRLVPRIAFMESAHQPDHGAHVLLGVGKLFLHPFGKGLRSSKQRFLQQLARFAIHFLDARLAAFVQALDHIGYFRAAISREKSLRAFRAHTLPHFLQQGDTDHILRKLFFLHATGDRRRGGDPGLRTRKALRNTFVVLSSQPGNIVRIIFFFRPPRPSERIGLAHKVIINAEQIIRQRPVVAAPGIPLQKLQESRVLRLIQVIEQFACRRRLYPVHFALVHDTNAGRKAQKRVIPAHYLAAKAVEGRDIRRRHKFRLVVQAAASAAGALLAQLACDTLAHLRRRCVRKRHDKHRAHVAPIFYDAYYAFCKDARLAAARCRGHKYVLCLCFDRPCLFFR